jgi:hypothetical protein
MEQMGKTMEGLGSVEVRIWAGYVSDKKDHINAVSMQANIFLRKLSENWGPDIYIMVEIRITLIFVI